MAFAHKPLGVPPLGPMTFDMLREASRRARSDMRRAWRFGLIFSAVFVGIGLLFLVITKITGQSYWLILAAVGFPLIGPFAAVGFYAVSRRIARGDPLEFGEVMGAILHQRKRQLPSMCAVIVILFLFWFFLAHMIFALFLGFSTMTNISNSYEVYLTFDGIKMLAVGSLVGAAFALLLYMITVIALPLLLDREVDFVTAMINSFTYVRSYPVPMLSWALLVAVATFAAMLPFFLGLFLVLPFFGHATWHIYDLAVQAGEAQADL